MTMIFYLDLSKAVLQGVATKPCFFIFSMVANTGAMKTKNLIVEKCREGRDWSRLSTTMSTIPAIANRIVKMLVDSLC